VSRDRLAYAAGAVIAAGVTADVVASTTGHRSTAVVTAAIVPIELIGLGFCLRAAVHPRLSPRHRRPWRFIAAWYVLQLGYGAAVGIAFSHVFSGAGRIDAALIAAIVLRIAETAVMLLGLFSFGGEPLTRSARRTIALDVSIVIGAAGMAIWYWVVGPGIYETPSPTPASHLAVVALPVCDLVLTVGVVTVLVRGVVTGSRTSFLLLVAGVTTNLGIDLYVVHAAAQVTAEGSSLYSDLLAFLPLVLLDAAAIERCRRAARTARENIVPRRLRPYSALPYLALIAANIFLLIVAVDQGPFPWPGLVLASITMSVAVAGRQLVSLSDSHRLAVTDALTGLANRRFMQDRMDQIAQQSRRTDRARALLLIDLDGFKQINDSHGHEAGDAILVAFAALLSRTARRSDLQARLGGDEFALVLQDITDPAQAVGVAERLIAELAREPLVPATGDRPALSVGCSIGIALIDPAETSEPDEHLRRADEAMYDAKKRKTTGWHLHAPPPPSSVGSAR
jgi:diguanylate cyclase (GGDEF)-like protein